MEVFTPKLGVAVILGSIASWFGEMWIFIAMVLMAMVLDYISGLVAGRANEGINSKRAIKGLYKKVGIFVLLCLGIFLDGAVNTFMQDGMGFFTMPFDAPIAHIVTIWIIITESVSICENLERAGVPIPKWLIKMLRKAEKKLDNEKDDTTEE